MTRSLLVDLGRSMFSVDDGVIVRADHIASELTNCAYVVRCCHADFGFNRQYLIMPRDRWETPKRGIRDLGGLGA
jgi:hypothetical protein